MSSNFVAEIVVFISQSVTVGLLSPRVRQQHHGRQRTRMPHTSRLFIRRRTGPRTSSEARWRRSPPVAVSAVQDGAARR